MTRKMIYPLLSALAGVAAMALAPAQAKQPDEPPGQSQPVTVTCEDSAMAAWSSGCIGPFKHSDNALGQVESLGAGFAYAGASNSGDPFIDAHGGQRAGTLTFDAPLLGPFVLGIRAGNMYSFYLFAGNGEGIDSIDFDTMGVVERGNGEAGVMTQAILFTPGGVLPQARVPGVDGSGEEIVTAPPTAQQVPEPASGALAVVALAAAGLAARRRRSR